MSSRTFRGANLKTEMLLEQLEVKSLEQNACCLCLVFHVFPSKGTINNCFSSHPLVTAPQR